MNKTGQKQGRRLSLDDLPNDRVVVLAAFLADAGRSYADTEDIAVKASELAPGRVSWRKYTDQNKNYTVRKRLWDAASEKKGQMLTGSEREGWLLTEAGLKFCEENQQLLDQVGVTAVRLSKKEQSWATRERARMQSEAAFLKWNSGHHEEIAPVEAERFFRIDDYVVGELRRSRITRSKDIFAADKEMSDAINEIAKKVRDRG